MVDFCKKLFYLCFFLCCFCYTDSYSVQRTYSKSTCRPSCPSGQKCVLGNCVLNVTCPQPARFGTGPPPYCEPPTDPLNKTKSQLETWFTKEIFEDLFPKCNIGWGPTMCFPYSYESFVIAARYFPNFGTESPNNSLTPDQNYKRDISAFFAHAIQETGENDISLYDTMSTDEADACFYRGGLYNWFEGGPTSADLPPDTPGYQPRDGNMCIESGRYCEGQSPYDYAYPCNQAQNGSYYFGCYLGRGAIQISYNYNYGKFQRWLDLQGLHYIDLLNDPNLVMTKTNPPLAMLASLWFYMTPQPPKPSMHDIILGNWEPGPKNRAVDYMGPIFGPTSLIINDECDGEDPETPGGPGENRRIKAFRWFCSYFNVPTGPNNTLSCKYMNQTFDEMPDQLGMAISWQPDWSTTWMNQSCNCAPQTYGGLIPYYQPNYFPQEFVDKNEINRLICIYFVYKTPQLFHLTPNTSVCLSYPYSSNIAEPVRLPV